MNTWPLFLLTVGAISLIALVGQHVWRLPRWLQPILVFTGFGGILAGMGLFALVLLMG